MTEAFILLGGIAIIFVAMAVRRRERAVRRSASATVGIDIDASGVVRRLADGRTETARWSELCSVEVVCTPVRTADGASEFLVLTESAAEGDERGCLVPLGVDLDAGVLARLTGLEGFRVERLNEAVAHRPPHRQVIWERSSP